MKTLIVGASTYPSRYSYLAANSLLGHGHEIVLLGKEKGQVAGNQILQGQPELNDVDTITLYINPTRQPELYDYLLNLKPRRIIFNPGTENPEFERMAENQGIEAIEGCTLVMLSTRQY